MFRRANTELPQDVSFPADLTTLGLKRNSLGQYVQIEHPDKFYHYDKFATKSTNDKFHEAVHEAIRNDVYGLLDKMGVKLIYAHDKQISGDGEFSDEEEEDDDDVFGEESKVLEEKPTIKMLHGGFDTVSEDVYVFVGDSRRELGIFSRMTTATAGGPLEGSFLGAAKALRMHASESWSYLPAMLVLNPGELLYSYETKSCMTQDTWNTRKRPHAFSESHAVKHENKVPGHATPEEHVKTVLDDILPQLLHSYHKNLSIIAIGDGGEHILKYLNDKLTADLTSKAGQLALTSVVLVNSSHDDDKIPSPQLKKFMAKHGRAWVSSPEPKNKVLGKVAAEFLKYAEAQDRAHGLSDNAPSVAASSDRSMDFPKREVPVNGRARAVSSLSEGVHQQKSESAPKSDASKDKGYIFSEVFYTSSEEEVSFDSGSESGVQLPPLISERYPAMAVPGLEMARYRKSADSAAANRRRSSSSVFDTSLANPDQYRNSGPSRPIPIPGRSLPVTKPRRKEPRQAPRKTEEDKQALDDAILVAEREMNAMASRNAAQATTQQSAPTPSAVIEAPADVAAEMSATQTYDYYGKPTICTTFSAGLEDITEQLFPAVRHDVLEFIFAEKDRRDMKMAEKAFRQRELREYIEGLGLEEEWKQK